MKVWLRRIDRAKLVHGETIHRKVFRCNARDHEGKSVGLSLFLYDGVKDRLWDFYTHPWFPRDVAGWCGVRVDHLQGRIPVFDRDENHQFGDHHYLPDSCGVERTP